MQVFLNRRDLVQTFDDVHGKRLVVTSRGHKIFYEDYPLAKLREKPWDGVWTVVMYDFPEERRQERRWIRERLMSLGFGSPQISILISPLPIEGPVQKLLEGEGVAEQVWTLRAERILGMENEAIARKAWPIIDELNLLYGELLDVLPKVKKNKKLKNGWREYFLAVNSADPYLPFELLPRYWKGEKCEQEFVKIGPAGLLKTLLKKLT
jgi:phenylacetic acid degradation operon negative regulatory protein